MFSAARWSALVLTAWAGSLWTICGLVTPGLFRILADNKSLAGNIAAGFFNAETWLGLVLGLLYLLFNRRQLDRLQLVLASVTMAAPLLFVLVLRPQMIAVRAAGDMARFGQLHGAASVLFLLACASAACLVWRSVARTCSASR